MHYINGGGASIFADTPDYFQSASSTVPRYQIYDDLRCVDGAICGYIHPEVIADLVSR